MGNAHPVNPPCFLSALMHPDGAAHGWTSSQTMSPLSTRHAQHATPLLCMLGLHGSACSPPPPLHAISCLQPPHTTPTLHSSHKPTCTTVSMALLCMLCCHHGASSPPTLQARHFRHLLGQHNTPAPLHSHPNSHSNTTRTGEWAWMAPEARGVLWVA